MNLDDEAERIAALHPCAGWSIFGRVGPWQPEHAVPKRPPRERLTEAQIENRVAMDLAAMDGGWPSEPINNAVSERPGPPELRAFWQRIAEMLEPTESYEPGQPLKRFRTGNKQNTRTYATKSHHKRQAWMQGERQRREAKRR